MRQKRRSLKLPSDHPGTKKLEKLMESGRPIADILQEHLPDPEGHLNNKFLEFYDNIIKLVPGSRTENKLAALGILFNKFIIEDVNEMDKEIFTQHLPAMLRGFANYDDMISKGSDQ